MGVISFRSGKKLEALIQKDIRDFNFSTKTEYIRQAIRELHDRLGTELAIRKLAKARGFAKRAGYKEPTLEEYERVRGEVGRKILARFKPLQEKSIISKTKPF